MIYLTVICALELAVIAGSLMLVKSILDARDRAEETWATERQALTNRVQRPDLLPSMPVQPMRRSPEDIARDRDRAREMASVGTVAHKAD